LEFGTAYQLAVGRFRVAGRSLDAYKRCTVYSIRGDTRNDTAGGF